MKILNMRASFGKLKNASLSLEEGLNIIQADNEAGKSTWCAFIRAMLYGINTSERDKSGYLSDKTKYNPWDGGRMEGTMELSAGGETITLQRTALGAAPMKKFSAVYSYTGEPVKELGGDSTGEKLTGASGKVFERTAFIRQAGLQVGKDPELEKRMAAIVSSGDEQISYSDADSRLRAWQRKLKYNKSGSIPKLELELKQVEEKLAAIADMNSALSEDRAALEALEIKRRQYAEDIATHEKLAKQAVIRRYWDAKRTADRAAENAAEVQSALTVNGRAITGEDVAAVRGAVAAIQPIQALQISAAEKLQAQEAAYDQAEENHAASPYSSFSLPAMKEDAETAERLHAAQTEAPEKPRRNLPGPGIILICLALLLAAANLLFLHMPILWAAAGAALAFGIFFTCLSGKDKAADLQVETLAAILDKYHCTSPGELSAAVEKQTALHVRLEQAKADLNAAREVHKSAEAALSAAKAECQAKIAAAIPGLERAENLKDSLTKIEALLNRRSELEAELSSARAVCAAYSREFQDKIPEESTEYLPVPVRDLESSKAALENTDYKIRQLKEQLNIAEGTFRALGDPVLLQGEVAALNEELTRQNSRYDALSLAIDTLSQASGEMQTRFSPVINDTASEILRRLTGGRYERLSFDRSFDADARTEGDAVTRNILSLSAGTADQIYLALRLALCQLLSSEDEPCPIVLDDALTNFDQPRLENALAYLKELAETRQIILFTCHSREAAYFAGDPGVHIVKL